MIKIITLVALTLLTVACGNRACNEKSTVSSVDCNQYWCRVTAANGDVQTYSGLPVSSIGTLFPIGGEICTGREERPLGL